MSGLFIVYYTGFQEVIITGVVGGFAVIKVVRDHIREGGVVGVAEVQHLCDIVCTGSRVAIANQLIKRFSLSSECSWKFPAKLAGLNSVYKPRIFHRVLGPRTWRRS